MSGASDRVLLLYLPFGALSYPSLGLSLLKSALELEGIPCDIRYLNYDLLDMLPGDATSQFTLYHRISGREYYSVGDWIFNGELFDADTVIELDRRFRVFMGEQGESHGLVWHFFLVKALARSFLDRVMQNIQWDRYGIVGFHSIFNQTVAGLAMAKRIKERFPEIVTLLGGPGAIGEMGHAILSRFGQIDFIVQGEADRTIVELVRAIQKGDDVMGMPGVVYRKRNEGRPTAVVENSMDLVTDLDRLPIPDYSDFFTRFVDRGYEPGVEVFLPIETARGCWWGAKRHCTFCGLSSCVMEFRCKSAERALAEFRTQYERYGVDRFHCSDCIMELDYYETLLPLLRDSDLDLSVFYWIKANVRRGQVKTLADAGVTLVQPGLEHLSSEVLHLMRKGTTYLKNVAFLKWAQERGMLVFWSIMYGFPGETPEQYRIVAERIPALIHLFPPKNFVRVRIDRFSPLLEEADAFGLSDVRPSGGYRHVYPFDEPELASFAYQFEADRTVDGVALDDDTVSLIENLLQMWNHRFFCGEARLDMLVGSRRLVIRDTRFDDVPQIFVLGGLAKALYLDCDSARTLSGLTARHACPPSDAAWNAVVALLEGAVSDPAIDLILRRAGEEGWPMVRVSRNWDAQDIPGILHSLVEAGLMVREGDSFLSLACRCDDLARFLGEKSGFSSDLVSVAKSRNLPVAAE
jgi:ribosomal peptide maturation radical SAM protein 1